MLYAVIGRDGPDAPRLRREHLQAHLDWVVTVMERIRVAGPLRDAPGGEPRMSLYVLEAADESAARDFLEGDPYFRQGVWERVDVMALDAAAGTWVGGARWLQRSG